MNYLHSLILGLVQGLTEFLPISSSAHLVLIPWLLKWGYQGLAYDVALHWGSTVAVLAYFRKDWTALLRGALTRGPCAQKNFFWGLVLGTMPAAAAGLLFEDQAEKIFRTPGLMASMLILFGLFMGLADRRGRKTKDLTQFDWRSCLIVGLAQALAIVPGVSRSGVTLTAALFLGFRRDSAARFSFLLSTPIILAAGILKLKDFSLAAMNGPFWAGIAASAVSSVLAIHFLLRYVRSKNLGVFVFYRILFGLLIFGIWGSHPARQAGLLAQVPPPQMAKLSDMEDSLQGRLYQHVAHLAGAVGERHPYNRKAYDQARDYVFAQFEVSGYKPELLPFQSRGLDLIDDGTVFHNIEMRLSPAAGNAVLIIGAHYDSAPGTPGADDNASAVAVLLELARLLKGRSLQKEVRLVAFANEEPPSFFTKNMGSWHYAQALKAKGEKVSGMISLEMLGYFNSAPGSQKYPPFLSWFYPDRGDFIGLVGNLSSRRFLKDCVKAWRASSAFPLESAALPPIFQASILSDHYNFQRAGYPGLMMTDTAFFRNPHYHESSDTPDKLDYERMASMTQSLALMVERIAGVKF